jgi:hypothetical protein
LTGVDPADLAALGFSCWLWAAARAQKNAGGIMSTAASFIFNMTEPFPLAAMPRSHCLKSSASQVKFSLKLVVGLYNFLVIRFNQQSHQQLATQ